MIKETACIYFSEDELNQLIGLLEENQNKLYLRLLEARKNIFRY